MGLEQLAFPALKRVNHGLSALEIPLVDVGAGREGDPMNAPKVTAEYLRRRKGQGRIAALTAYDYPSARLLDEAGLPLVLVGDSVGMVMLGMADTTEVTMADMEHHVRAVARARPRALVAADLPYHSYTNPKEAVLNARRLIAAGADAVKGEGGRAIQDQVSAIVADGIPFLGHLGMLPQQVRELGGYRIRGKTPEEREALLADGDALVSVGAFAVVLELVSPPVAAEMTRRLPIPTIGIGSGPDCDGQVLVLHDLVGGYPWFTPRHAKPQADIAATIRETARRWRERLEAGPVG